MAQEVERILGKDEVTSSTLVSSSKKKRFLLGSVSFCVCVRRIQHRFATQLQTSFDRRSTSFRLRTQNEVALCANSVMLRTNDVG